MTVTRDATSLKYLPATATEWTQFLSGVIGSPANPDSIWNNQDASTPIVDANSIQNLTSLGNGPTTQTGWTRKGQNLTDGSANGINSTAGPFGDPYAASHLLFAMIALTGAPAASHDVMGFGGLTAYRGAQATTASNLGFFDLSTSTLTSGVATYGTTVHPIFLQYDRTNSLNRIITDLETINAVYNASTTTTLLLTWGAAATTNAGINILYGSAWRGTKAEMSAATIAAIIGRINTGPPSLVLQGIAGGVSAGIECGLTVGI